jgi:stage II sporulation protein P
MMAKMRLKNNNKKKKKIFKFSYLIYLGIIYLSFSFTYYFSMKYSNIISDKEFINLLLEEEDVSSIYKNLPTKAVSKTMNFLFDINISSPSTILNATILKYGGNSSTSNNTKDEEEEISLEEVEKTSDYIEDPNPSEVENPLVYLYNTHQLENYSSEYLEIYGIKPNVQMSSYILKEKLNEMSISTIVEDTDITTTLKDKNWPYYRSYDVTRELIEAKIKKYPSLKYFIDLHRDSVTKSATTVNIGNKYYAKVLFVLGLEYDSYKDNLEFMEDLNNLLEENYPGISRGILKKEGEGVNGIYNQDINSQVILIEVGGAENTIEEVYNTITALADVLNKYIGDDNN